MCLESILYTGEVTVSNNVISHLESNLVSGSESGDWYIDLKTGKGSTGQGKPPTAADATLTMDSKDFFDMFSGNESLCTLLYVVYL
jgi:hypothetical protein